MENILESKTKPFTREQIIAFGRATGDYCMIHRNAETARAYKFLDIPVMGAHILMDANITLSNSEQFSGKKLTQAEIKFKNPLYVDRTLNWILTHKTENGLEKLTLEGNSEDGKVAVVSMTFQDSYPEFNDKEINWAEQFHLFRYTLDAPKLSKLNESLDNKGLLPVTYSAALVPPATLDYLESEEKEPMGINLGMEFNFFRDIAPGEFTVKLYKTKNRRKIEAVCGNNHYNAAHGIIKILTV